MGTGAEVDASTIFGCSIDLNLISAQQLEQQAQKLHSKIQETDTGTSATKNAANKKKWGPGKSGREVKKVHVFAWLAQHFPELEIVGVRPFEYASNRRYYLTFTNIPDEAHKLVEYFSSVSKSFSMFKDALVGLNQKIVPPTLFSVGDIHGQQTGENDDSSDPDGFNSEEGEDEDEEDEDNE